MITLYDLLNLLDLEAELEVLEWDGDLLQEGTRGSTMWDDDLLDRCIRSIIPGIITKILLDSED
jgi:hypothetical protein